jgi:hypothetical protein
VASFRAADAPEVINTSVAATNMLSPACLDAPFPFRSVSRLIAARSTRIVGARNLFTLNIERR